MGVRASSFPAFEVLRELKFVSDVGFDGFEFRPFLAIANAVLV